MNVFSAQRIYKLTVGAQGRYDILNHRTIARQVQLEWNSSSGISRIGRVGRGGDRSTSRTASGLGLRIARYATCVRIVVRAERQGQCLVGKLRLGVIVT